MFDALQTLVDNGVDGCVLNEVIDNLINNDCFEDCDDKVGCIALSYLNENGDRAEPNEIIVLGDNFVQVYGREYLVLTDEEADKLFDDYLECMLDDGAIDGADSPYFDRCAWKRDAKINGRGSALADYDGEELEHCIGAGEYWFLYRTH